MGKTRSRAILLLMSTLSLSTSAGQLTPTQNQTILCDLFSINCPVITTKGGGGGMEPPKKG